MFGQIMLYEFKLTNPAIQKIKIHFFKNCLINIHLPQYAPLIRRYPSGVLLPSPTAGRPWKF